MDNPGEILRLCRLCLVKDQVNIPIFEEQGDIRQTFLKIRSCLPVKVSRDDKLPKKICGGCSNKLDLFYEFWSSTANSEKTLQSWLGQEEEDDKMQEITKPVEALVKEESEALEDGHAHDQSFDEATKDEAEAPPAKRARRTAAVKAQINISHDSDEDEDVDGAEPITKIEDESDDSDGEEKDPSYTEVPGTSADDQAGPSGLGKDGVEAPYDLSTVCQVLLKKTPSNLLIKTFQCNQCFKFFSTKKYLKRHIKNHLRNLMRQFKCLHCSKTFASNYALKSHMEVHENRPAIFECDICNKKFKRLKNLDLHRRRHTKDFVIECEECHQGFVCKGDYVQHVRNRHDGEKEKVVCFVCGKDMIKGHLKRHMENVHGETGEFPCELCGKIFDRKIGHERHVKMFHNLVPQVCDICGQEFRWKHSLRDHLKSHAGVKPHQCTYCDKAFTRSDFLKQHIRTHTGQRPFECPECGKGFTQATPLKVHMKGVHKNQSFGGVKQTETVVSFDALFPMQPEVGIGSLQS
ncbi:zinc finger protein 260-like isoform X40 [Euwallacea similis]|uniref:zinc finger protein 260-like isoform X40 n=1 Tax=Euwallacea similis TaxID=1736056 RepID=UPI00344D5A43